MSTSSHQKSHESTGSGKVKRVLITGAGSGLGQHLAVRMARNGHRVIAGVRDRKRALRELPGDLPEDRLKIVNLDVTRQRDVDRTLETIRKEFGGVDILVNNAGIGVYGAFEDLSLEDYRDIMETNFFAVLRMTKAILPLMRENRSGIVANVSSILGRITLPVTSPYTSSKWALEAFSESLRHETEPHGIRVVLIEPGLIRTSFKKNTRFTPRLKDPEGAYHFLYDMVQKDYSGFYTEADVAAASMERILMKSRPALRYRIGWDAWFYDWMNRLLPEMMKEQIIRHRVMNSWKKRSPP